jgi:hypothetical protein
MLQPKIIAGIDPAALLEKLKPRGATIFILNNSDGVPFGRAEFTVTSNSLDLKWLNLTDANLSPPKFAELYGLGTSLLRAALRKAREMHLPSLRILSTNNYKLLHLINAKISADAVYFVQENSEKTRRQSSFAEYPWLKNRYIFVQRKNWLIRFEESAEKKRDPAAWQKKADETLLLYFYDGKTFTPNNEKSSAFTAALDQQGRFHLRNKETGRKIPAEQLGKIEIYGLNVIVVIPVKP